jgi:DNA-directed RNA polymerase specialized sigma24 family protein
MERDLLGRFDASRGGFRTFLKAVLENFLADDARRARRLRRGGGVRIQSMAAAGGEFDVADPESRSPGDVLDDAWRREVLRRVVAGLEDGYRCEGRQVWFAVFRDYYLGEEDVDHAALARRYAITRAQVSNHLQHAKRRYREVLRQALCDTVESHEALQDEIDWFTGRA